MTTTEQRLADALRCVSAALYSAGDLETLRSAISWRVNEALAACDARQAATRAPDKVRADGQEFVGHDWDSGPQAWDVIRTDDGEWLCIADPEHSARIVLCLSAHDGLVSALQGVLNSGERYRPEMGRDWNHASYGDALDALAAAGVTS